MVNKKYLKAQDIADIFGLSAAHIRRLARDGKIPYVQIGSRYLFNEVNVRQYLIREVKRGTQRN